MKRTRDPVEQAIDRALPIQWTGDLATAFSDEWRKAVRPRGNPAAIRRIAFDLERQIRERLGDPEAPRTRLRALARRLVRASTPDRELRRQLDGEAERLVAPIAARAEGPASTATEQLLAELALEKEARRLHRFVARFNWDGGGETMRAVIEDEACAIGTALLVYWLARPHYYRQYSKRSQVPSYERVYFDLLRRIEVRLAARDEDRYFHLGIVFDPRTWETGYDWTADVYAKLPRKVELPAQVWIRTTALGVEPIVPARPRRRSRRA